MESDAEEHFLPSDATVEVLYGDYNGHWRQLDHMYYSQDSKCLAADHPESVQEEVESHYCPHCNSLWQAEAQANNYRCLQCFECPSCGCVLGTAPVNPLDGGTRKHSFRCFHCRWTSEHVGLVEDDPASLAMAALVREREDPSQPVFAKLVAGVKQREASARSKRAGMFPASRGGSTPPVPHGGPWKVADIEERLAKHAREAATASQGIPRPDGSSGPPPIIPPCEGGPDPELWAVGAAQMVRGVNERVMQPSPAGRGGGGGGGGGGGSAAAAGAGPGGAGLGGGGEGVDPRLQPPQRLPLRTQRSKRCRRDLGAGRTGILIKPSINPLEGDSSNAAKRGAWFKKDCSAVLLVPRVAVVTLPPAAALRAGRPCPLVLRVTNPQDSGLQLRLAPRPPSAAATATRRGGGDGEEGEGEGGAEEDGVGEGEGTAGGAAGAGGPAVGGAVLAAAEKKREKEGEGGWATAAAAAAAAAAAVARVLQPADGWVKLDAKEDELLRQPGEQAGLPDHLHGGKLPGGGGRGGGGADDPPALLLHQQGEVAWVQLVLLLPSGGGGVPAAEAAAAAVAVAAAAAAATPSTPAEAGATGAAAAAGGTAVEARFEMTFVVESEEDSEARFPMMIRFKVPQAGDVTATAGGAAGS